MTVYSLISLFISSSRPSCAGNTGYAVTGSMGRPAKDVPEGGALGEGRCRINVKRRSRPLQLKRPSAQRERECESEGEMGRWGDGKEKTCKLI